MRRDVTQSGGVAPVAGEQKLTVRSSASLCLRYPAVPCLRCVALHTRPSAAPACAVHSPRSILIQHCYGVPSISVRSVCDCRALMDSSSLALPCIPSFDCTDSNLRRLLASVHW